MRKFGIIFAIISTIFFVSFLLGKNTKVCIVTLDNRVWRIELATTPEEQQRGLMYRTELCERCGMLFVFNEDVPKNFWMKNTLLPLDIYFYNGDGVLVDSVKNMRPEQETMKPMEYVSQPAQYVLEVNTGSQFFQPESFDPRECL